MDPAQAWAAAIGNVKRERSRGLIGSAAPKAKAKAAQADPFLNRCKLAEKWIEDFMFEALSAISIQEYAHLLYQDGFQHDRTCTHSVGGV